MSLCICSEFVFVTQRVEHLPGGAVAGAERAFDIAGPNVGGLGAGPVDAADGHRRSQGLNAGMSRLVIDFVSSNVRSTRHDGEVRRESSVPAPTLARYGYHQYSTKSLPSRVAGPVVRTSSYGDCTTGKCSTFVSLSASRNDRPR